MRPRFPLLLKKRGRRRTGSPLLELIGESLYHAMFVVAGVIGLWWTLSDVLIPEWRLANEAADFRATTCRIVGQRVLPRPGLAEPEYGAELEVRFTPEEGEPVRVWTRHGVARDSPSREEADAALHRFQIGDELPCWYDPADPQRVMLSVRRRWWPLLVLSIPISLVVIGVFGLVRTLVSSRSSPERRSALLAEGIDLSSFEGATARPTIASGLPPLERVEENPGVEQAYRLPADGSEGWRVVGMGTLCLVWNVLVALFAYQIGVGYLSPAIRLGVAALVAAPLAVIGWRMTLSTWRDARGVGGGGATRLEVDRHPLRCGEPAVATLLQWGGMRLRSLEASLVCEEIATFRQGTDARTAVAEVARSTLLSERRLELVPGEPLRRDLCLEVPHDGPHSFVSPNNEVRWTVEVKMEPVGRNTIKRRFPLCVFPAAPATRDAKPEPDAAPEVAPA